MEFTKWEAFGDEFLVKSSINDWVSCTPGSGSLVEMTAGSISCSNIKNMGGGCSGRAPTSLATYGHGPAINVASLFYYWDGYIGSNWPTHDPCGSNQANHNSNPDGDFRGAIYVRSSTARRLSEEVSVSVLGAPLFDESKVDDATVYVTLASSDIGVWSPFSWYPYVPPSKWAAIVTEAADTSAVATLFDRGYGWVYLTSEAGLDTKSTLA